MTGEPPTADEPENETAQPEGAAAPDDPPAPSAGHAAIELELPPPLSVPRPAPYVPPRIVPAARIDDVTPSEGPILGDTRLTIVGEHLYRESIVRVDGQIARTVGASEPHQLKVLTPPRQSPGRVAISIQNPNSEIVTAEGAFHYLPLPPPGIATVAPDHVSTKGGEVTITGEGFVRETVVLLDNLEARAKLVDASTIDVTVPSGAHGKTVDVVVRNPDGQERMARRAFMYDERY
jgi:hypothetical protein